MPKIIDGVRENLLSAARTQLLSGGYTALSLRALARECKIAVGTIYNYFDSKESLVAHVIAADWQDTRKKMKDLCLEAATVPDGICAVFTQLQEFERMYSGVFSQFAGLGRPAGLSERHQLLRSQLVEQIDGLLARFGRQDRVLSPIAAETVLASSLQPDIDEAGIRLFAEKLFEIK